MKLTLKPEHQKLIEAKLDTGRYTNPDEIIAEALQLLSKRDQYQQWVEDIGQKIDIAAEQLDRGEGIDGETAIAQLKARLQKKGLEIMRVVKGERGLDALFSENL